MASTLERTCGGGCEKSSSRPSRYGWPSAKRTRWRSSSGSPDWLDHLYIDASATGRGLGTTLVDLAKRELGGQLQLWTFQSNIGACRFYERQGFQAVQRTDGDNEEKAPDVRYLFVPDLH